MNSHKQQKKTTEKKNLSKDLQNLPKTFHLFQLNLQ